MTCMKRIGPDISSYLMKLAGGNELALINIRTIHVRSRYKRAIESVYKDSAALHLAHTNNVIITKKRGLRTLIVYVDESIFAAELNAQRELIQLRLLELFGEEIDQFEILVSRWRKYKNYHPYLKNIPASSEREYPDIPLSGEQEAFVAEAAAAVEDIRLRNTMQRAMKAAIKRQAQKQTKKDNQA